MEKIIVIVGPTGVGKTSLSVEIATQFQGEIISGDAYQVYKGMDIGTAKVSEEEKKGIPHYLVDSLSLDDEYNVKLFQEWGRAKIQDIIQRGKVPIVCGGTGLYIKALLYDYAFEEEEEDKGYLDSLSKKSDESLFAMLLSVDEKACDTIHPNNRKRVIRALMMAHTGTKKSARLEAQSHTLLYDALVIGLRMDRPHLYERINHRVDTMIEKGLFAEVKQLAKSEDDFLKQSMRAIGYKEWCYHLYGEASEDDVCELIKKNSRRFAKRQYTWFTHQMDVSWYDVDEKKSTAEISEDCRSFLQDNTHG